MSMYLKEQKPKKKYSVHYRNNISKNLTNLRIIKKKIIYYNKK